MYRLACLTPLVLESPVTAIAFLPTSQDHSENMSRLLAVGLENGKLVVVRYDHQLFFIYFFKSSPAKNNRLFPNLGLNN